VGRPGREERREGRSKRGRGRGGAWEGGREGGRGKQKSRSISMKGFIPAKLCMLSAVHFFRSLPVV
jgi:hypothetical protein